MVRVCGWGEGDEHGKGMWVGGRVMNMVRVCG